MPSQVGLDEWVEIAVEDAFDVAGLVLGAQVLHQLVRSKHVTTYLAAEADALLLTFDRREHPFDVRSRTLLADGPNGHVVLTHFPVLSLEDRARDAAMLYAGHLSQLAPAPASLPEGGPVVVLSGHLHLRGITHDGDVLQMVFAALVEPPYEFARVQIESDNGRMSVDYSCWSAHVPDAPKLPVLDADQGRWQWRAGEGWSQLSEGRW